MKELDNYRILQELGKQSIRKFGKVYLVQHKETGHKAVLKHLEKATVKENIVDRLRSEASFNFNLKGLPKIISSVEDELQIILLKSYEVGIPLDEYWLKVKRKDRLSKIKTIVQELVPLFEHLQQQSIVHCDLKPSNVLVKEDEARISVALIDFGMATRYPSNEKRSVLFPLGYAAPELILNEFSIIDQRTDYYALGILLWRLFENKLPLMHPNPSIFTNLQLNHPTPVGEAIPKELMLVIHRLTSKYAFEIPPNKLSAMERIEKLKIGINNRPASIQEIAEQINQIKEKRWLFF